MRRHRSLRRRAAGPSRGWGGPQRWWGLRRGDGRILGVVFALLVTASVATDLTAAPAAAATSGSPTRSQQASAITAIARNALTSMHLNAVIYRVTVNGTPVVTGALGTSIPGVRATTSMHFPNGAVAFSYLSTLLMEFVDEHKVTLDEPIKRWMPNLPDAGQVTLKMLANNTSGYPDFETNPIFLAQQYADPFRSWSYQQRLVLTFDQSPPVLYTPGTNWSYSHSNMMILGVILQKIGGKPLATLLRQKVLGPMGLNNTIANSTAYIPSPALNGFSSERRVTFGIPATTPFYEDTTAWNSPWGTPPGGTETTNIYDLTKTAQAVGSGFLLSRSATRPRPAPTCSVLGRQRHSARAATR